MTLQENEGSRSQSSTTRGKKHWFRFSVLTLLLLTLVVALGMAWWRDHRQMSSTNDLQARQIRKLQQQVDEQHNVFVGNLTTFRLKNAEDLVQFVEKATDQEFHSENWGPFGNSHVANQSVPLLLKLLDSPQESTRIRALTLFAWMGRAKRPPEVDPIPKLISLLENPSSRTRTSAMWALGKNGRNAKDALPSLKAIMERDISHNSYCATMAVEEIDAAIDIGPRLRELFLHGNNIMRQNVAFRLPDHLPAKEAREILSAQYERETDNEVRESLAQAMNKVKN